MKRLIIVVSIISIVISISVFFLIQNNQNKVVDETNPRNDKSSTSINTQNFLLPFNIEDVDEQNGEVNPLGVVRFDKDVSEFGHSGIDIPLYKGSNIYAASDGEIIYIKSSGDPWGGMEIAQLISKTAEGEGWVLGYEHVTPVKGVSESSIIKKGDLIATKTAPAGFTAHFQFHKAFNDFQYKQDYQCWPELLTNEENKKLISWWNKYRDSNQLKESWNTTADSGKFMYRGLLDESTYPDGPQLCYPPGTDVR